MSAPQSRWGHGQPSSEAEGTGDVDELAVEFGWVARLLEAEDDTGAMLDQLVASAIA